MKSKINKKQVDACHPKEIDHYVWDTATKGFGLKTTPKGRKVYILQYRNSNETRTRRHTIGAHGSPWTPDSARTEAMKLLAKAKSGEDLRELRRTKQTTVSDLCDLYMSKGTHAKKKVR